MHMGMTKLCILLFFLLERCRLLAFAYFLDDVFYVSSVQITAPKSRTVSSPPPFPAERRKPQQRSKVDSVREFTRGEIFNTELTGKFRSENLELHLKIWMKLKVAPNSRSTFLAGSAQCSTHTLKPRRSSKDYR